jgi:predicted peptidase
MTKGIVKRTPVVAVLACIVAAGDTAAQTSPGKQTAQKFEAENRRTIHSEYLLFVPSRYNEDARRRWPLILYLHGGSVRGEDVNRLRTLGLPHRLEHDPQFPFVVVAPLCPGGEIWTDTDALSRLLDEVVSKYRIDKNRVYLTGHSMGGRGALYLAYKCPDRFAAVVAISPLSPITTWAKQLRSVPLWIIHGAKDAAAPIKDSEELVRAIQQSGGHPNFTPLPDRDHFILDVYDKNDVFDWMTERQR